MWPEINSRDVLSDEAQDLYSTLSYSKSLLVIWLRSIKYSDDIKLKVLTNVLDGGQESKTAWHVELGATIN